MGIPDRKYSDEQRAAMLYVREQGGTYRENAEQLAREGCPALDVEPFEVPEPTLRGEVPRMQRQAAKRTQLVGPLDQVADDVIRRMLTVVSAELGELEGRGGRLDLKRLDDLSKIAARLRAPTRGKAPTSDPENPDVPEPTPDPERSPFMDQLAGDRPSQEGDADQAEADPDGPSPLTLPPSTGATATAPGPDEVALRRGGHEPIPHSREEHGHTRDPADVADLA